MGAASSSPLRQMLEGQLSQLSTEVERLFDEARNRARRELADQLNQSVRRLRQTNSLDDLAATLLDAAIFFCTGAAIFRITGQSAKGERIRGVAAEHAGHFSTLTVPFSAAPAIAGAVESRDPVIAVTSPGEVSPDLVAIAGHTAAGRAYLYPLVVKESVPVLLYCWGTVQGAVLELLAQVAAAQWESLDEPEPQPLVQIAATAAPSGPAVQAGPEPPASVPVSERSQSAWESLSPEEQAIHLRAQRFARVQIAELRLHDAAAVQSGRAQRNLYDALRPKIDKARLTFQENFFARCPSMVDYLHVEILRSLAHEDQDLLGQNYPGPLV